MKRSGLLAALLLGALGLIGCGDGGLQSPDFTPVLTGVSLGSDGAVDPSAPAGTDQRVLAAGQSASLVALGTFTTPPGFTDASGAPASTQDKLLGDAGFSLTPDGIATVSNGQITGNTVGGIVTVTAVKDGISSNPISFRVAPPVLVSLDVTPDTITISPLETATFSATGTFSDGTVAPVVVDWTVAPGGVVTLSNSNAQNTVATPATGSNGLSATVTGTINNAQGTAITDSATIDISDEIITALTDLRPTNPTVAPGASIEFTAIGTFTDGTNTRTGDLPDSVVDWSSSVTTVAPIDADGIATGQAPGGQSTTITATLKPSVVTPASNSRNASTELFVTDARCTGPLLSAQGATTSTSVDPLCIGCSISNQGNVIDGNMNSFASISSLLGLLTGSATLNVDAAPTATDFAAGQRAGFVVAQPAGLLSVELLSALSVSTRNNGAVVEAAGAQASSPLTITALGTIGGQSASLISFVTSQPYDGLALTFNSGVASVLPTINAFQACAVAVDTTP
tara:strand:+ start:78406 stop:79944 length:1539 start_codon:yes stop_codon:yes gene_type:complete